MRIAIQALILLLALRATAAAEPTTKPFELRGLKFGASEELIRRTDKSQYQREQKIGAEKLLVYSDALFGHTVTVAYRLLGDSLYDIRYIFHDAGRCSTALDLVTQLEQELSGKYGEATAKDFIRDDRCLRKLEWNFTASGRPIKIMLILDGTKYSSKLGVYYVDLKQSDSVAAAQSVADKDKL